MADQEKTPPIEHSTNDSKTSSKGFRSDVRPHFVIKDRKAKCKFCNILISFCGNTTNMRNHLLAFHSNEYNGGNKSNQPKISQYTLPKARQEKLNQELALLLVSKCLPLSLSESPAFRRYATVLSQGNQVPCAKTLKKNYITPMEENVRTKIKEDAKNKKFALTCDLWSSVKQESYLGLTCHFIKDSKKYNVTLECVPFPAKHDNVNIREMVKTYFKHYTVATLKKIYYLILIVYYLQIGC